MALPHLPCALRLTFPFFHEENSSSATVRRFTNEVFLYLFSLASFVGWKCHDTLSSVFPRLQLDFSGGLTWPNLAVKFRFAGHWPRTP